MEIEIDRINRIAIEAGRKILEFYSKEDKGINIKSDSSPITRADLASHEIIFSALAEAYPEIPVVSEECKHADYIQRKHWSYFWLVDPLDGTKEFINGNGEFTVNIALIEKDKPVLGVIYAPVADVLYFASREKGAFKKAKDSGRIRLKVNPAKKAGLTAVKSRSHSSEEEEKQLSNYSVQNIIHAGSSLKFCMVAEGCADIYLRHGRTCEWDTAAGQAILECAGGYVHSSGQSLKYNKPQMINDSFVAANSATYFQEN